MKVEDTSGMRPKLGDANITLPITFDYSGGRKDKQKSIKLWSIILGIVGFIVTLGIFFGDKEFYIKIPLGLASIFVFSFVIRFLLLKEKEKKEEYKGIIANDYKMDYKEFWGIYNVEDMHPYICRFRNGKSGLYIRLNKDVILGKYADSEYEHYEAIADAYNLAGADKVQMVHIDYMDNVGSDERLEESFIALEDVKNPDLKELLTDIYSFQQSNMLHRVTTFDIYVFMWTGNDISAWNTISRILNCFLEANYRSYQILNERDLRELTKIIFNLNDFSVADASAHAFEGADSSKNIVPISIENADGSIEIINKTSEEKAKEREAHIKERKAQEEELERRKREKKNKKHKSEDSNEDIYKDMF
jgi:hypothetical protein